MKTFKDWLEESGLLYAPFYTLGDFKRCFEAGVEAGAGSIGKVGGSLSTLQSAAQKEQFKLDRTAFQGDCE